MGDSIVVRIEPYRDDDAAPEGDDGDCTGEDPE